MVEYNQEVELTMRTVAAATSLSPSHSTGFIAGGTGDAVVGFCRPALPDDPHPECTFALNGDHTGGDNEVQFRGEYMPGAVQPSEASGETGRVVTGRDDREEEIQVLYECNVMPGAAPQQQARSGDARILDEHCVHIGTLPATPLTLSSMGTAVSVCQNDGGLTSHVLHSLAGLTEDTDTLEQWPMPGIASSQPETTGQTFACPVEGCNTAFRRRRALCGHVIGKHPDALQDPTLQNLLCQFSDSQEKDTLMCVVEGCNQRLLVKDFRRHSKDAHKEWLEQHGRYLKMEFQSADAFESWKTRYEQENAVLYVRQTSKSTTSWVFVCNRHLSSTRKEREIKHGSRSSGKGKAPRTRQKKESPNKQFKCPGRMYVNKRQGDGVVVEVINVHTHDIGEGNMQHTRISSDMRGWIASRLRDGVPPNAILAETSRQVTEQV